jgi:IMP dehydrogenase
MSAITGRDMAIAMYSAGGMGFVHRYMDVVKQSNIALEFSKTGISAGFSSSSEFSRAYNLIDDGAKILTMDVAHGWSEKNIDLLKRIHNDYPRVRLISGNITEPAALYELSEYVDAVRVGIGEGAACITRDVAGVNVPLATCIMELVETKKQHGLDTKLIVDGGIRTTGDIVKCLALGADAVISGYLLKGTKEAERKEYFGMASELAMKYRAEEDPEFKYDSSIHTTAPEGRQVPQIMTGNPRPDTVEDRMKKMAAGIRIGFSYLGASNIKELRERAKFVIRA